MIRFVQKQTLRLTLSLAFLLAFAGSIHFGSISTPTVHPLPTAEASPRLATPSIRACMDRCALTYDGAQREICFQRCLNQLPR